MANVNLQTTDLGKFHVAMLAWKSQHLLHLIWGCKEEKYI
jgi:hypothetical protein